MSCKYIHKYTRIDWYAAKTELLDEISLSGTGLKNAFNV